MFQPFCSRPSSLVIATRQSRLALWQANFVRRLLQDLGHEDVQILGLTTEGDRVLDRPLSEVGGKGLFVKEIEQALQDGRADMAVHSLKDVPMELPAGFMLACVLKRDDPRDAWVSVRYPSLHDLPPGSIVGTSSLRRVAQLRALRPDLQTLPLRGNVDTRLRKLDEGQAEGIMLAVARVMGESAPVLILVGATRAMNFNPFDGNQQSLPLQMLQEYNSGPSGYETVWGSALTLVIAVAIVYVAARLLAAFTGPRTERS